MTSSERATYFVRGRVQGVGFRWWTRSRALELGLVGHARNMDDGRVEVVAEGDPGALDRLEELLRETPDAAKVALDDEGYVLVEGRTTRTNIPGVFACGDVADPTYQQAITAAGSGCRAALDAEHYLTTLQA